MKQGIHIFYFNLIKLENKRFEIIYTQGKLGFLRLILITKSDRNSKMLNFTAAESGITVMIDQVGNPSVDENFKK
ncbi:hypothetical protein [Lysinibacillus halotolerans]|uniref:hypothetical protein n=1 Tax=Lysinibacillus halotolerans TaxID=1368476 RepID=UPI001F4E3536|nr:hypothetical protein [Lysinibacillus halotolerans]